jgi:hypothetical protein
VHDNIDGVGPVQRAAIFDTTGGYDELSLADVMDIEENLSVIEEFHTYFFEDIFDADDDVVVMDDADGWIRDIKARHKEWYKKWQHRQAARKQVMSYPNPNRRTAS